MLRAFYQETVGTPRKVRPENRTELTGLLRAYQDLNGNLVQDRAEPLRAPQHRFTNQLKKIRSSRPRPARTEGHAMLSTGLMIRDIL